MGHRIAKTFAGGTQPGASLRQTKLQLLNPRLRAVNFRLRILLVKALRHALLARNRAFELSIQRDIHALAQTIQHRLLTRQAQLRVLLQTMMKLGKATGTVGEEVVHRHFKALLAVLDLTQQLQLVATHHARKA
jgi:hypothetical protein